MLEEVTKNSIKNLSSFFTDNHLPVVNAIELENNPFLHVIAYKKDDKIIGYLNYSVMYDKAELNYIYVVSDYRNSGVGKELIKYLIDRCKDCQNITLEVRKDNIPAINLYKKYGFKECVVRKNYYQGIDGILMIYERGE